MKAEICSHCGRWAEPPFKRKVSWDTPARPLSLEEVVRFMRGEEFETTSLDMPLCRNCAYAESHGMRRLTEDEMDALDRSDED